MLTQLLWTRCIACRPQIPPSGTIVDYNINDVVTFWNWDEGPSAVREVTAESCHWKGRVLTEHKASFPNRDFLYDHSFYIDNTVFVVSFNEVLTVLLRDQSKLQQSIDPQILTILHSSVILPTGLADHDVPSVSTCIPERQDFISTRVTSGNEITEPRRPDTSLQPSK
jgi:hypothetical protein